MNKRTANENVFVVIDKGAGAYEAFCDAEAAHKSIEGDEFDFDVFCVPLRKEPFDSENPSGGVQQPCERCRGTGREPSKEHTTGAPCWACSGGGVQQP